MQLNYVLLQSLRDIREKKSSDKPFLPTRAPENGLSAGLYDLIKEQVLELLSSNQGTMYVIWAAQAVG